jgi:hypothetical protein
MDSIPVARIDLAREPRAALEAMLAAGKEARECVRVLAKTGDTLVGELLKRQREFTAWTHYPAGDVHDPVTHAEYYYHAHGTHDRRREHGHFHCFLRASGMPVGVRPAKVADLARSEIAGEAMAHLVAIAMDASGTPIRLFTTNRWVTGEVWYAGADVTAMLGRFAIARAAPSWPVNRWLGAMIRLFRPQIAALIEARDASIAAHAAAHPDVNVFEDRALEITSALDIDVERQIAAIRAAIATSSPLRGIRSARGVPSRS